MDKTAQNTFTKGMALDNNQYIALNSTMRSCLNGTLFTLGDKENVLQNDLGNGKFGYTDVNGNRHLVHLKEGFIPLKTKEHNGILYILSKNFNTGEEEIGSIPSPSYTETKDVQADLITTSPIYTEVSTKIQKGDRIQISWEDVEMNTDKGYDIHFWDLNNTKTSTSKQNKLGELEANLKYYDQTKSTDITNKFQGLIKTPNFVVYKSDQLNLSTNFDTENYGTLNAKFKVYNDDDFGIKVNVNYSKSYVEDSFQFNDVTSGNATVTIKYNCPDGKYIQKPNTSDFSELTNQEYNYIDGEREVNFFNKVQLYKYSLTDNPIIVNGEQQYEDITNYLSAYNYLPAEKLFTRTYTFPQNILNGYSWDLKMFGKKWDIRTKENYTWETYSRGEKISINTLINLNNYNNPLNKKYNKFFWTKAGYHKIMTEYDYDKKQYRIDNLSYPENQVIWNVTEHPNQALVFYDLDNSTKKDGIILRPSFQVGHEIYGENNEVNEGGRFRYLYELPDTIINKDHNYIVLELSFEYDIDDRNPTVTDVQYYFPKIKHTYIDSDTVIPNSLHLPKEEINPSYPSDKLGGYIQNGLETEFKEDDYGVNAKAAIFGQSMSDTSRVWGFKPVGDPDSTDLNLGFITGVPDRIEISSNTDINKTLTYGIYNKDNQRLYKENETFSNLNVLIKSSSSVEEENKKYSCMIDYVNIYKIQHVPPYDYYTAGIINSLDDLPKYSDFKYEQLGDKLIQDNYNYDINTDSINNLSDSNAKSDLQVEDGGIYYTKTDGSHITGLIIEPSTRHYSQVNISTNLFTKQNPHYETIELSFFNGSFYIGNTKVTDLKQYLKNSYRKYAKEGCFISLVLNNVTSSYQTHELFLYKDDNNDCIVTYFPMLSTNITVISTNCDRYLRTGDRSFTSKLDLLDYPISTKVPKVSRKITINIGSNIENQIKYKNQKWLGSDGVLEKRMRQWNFPDKIKDVVNGVNNRETKIFDFQTSGSSITVDEYNNLRVHTNLKYRTLVNDMKGGHFVNGTSYYTGFDNGSDGILYYDPSTNRLTPVFHEELNRDVCKIVDFGNNRDWLQSFNNSELIGVTNPNYIICNQTTPSMTYQFKAGDSIKSLNFRPDFVVNNVSTQNPQFEIL